MDVFSAIEGRRAVKKYDPDFVIPEGDVEKILSATVLSPTSFNIQHWRFVRVQDPALRAAVKEAAGGQEQVTDAALLFVLCGDIKAWEKEPQRYWRNAPEESQAMILPMIKQFYEGRDQVQRDEVMRSGGIAAQSLMLSAHALGYDSCPMIGFDADKVGALINLPDDHAVVMMIAVGKAVEPAHPRGGSLALNDVVITDKFPG